jgi:hypothetical protein
MKFEKGFEKGDMHVVIAIELTTIVSSITTFQPKLIFMFFYMDSIRKFIIFIQNFKFRTIVVIFIDVKGHKIEKVKNNC